MKYRFQDEKKKHVHELAKDDVNYAPLKGTTTIISEVFPPPLAWWGSRMALEPIGFTTEKIEPNEAKRLKLASEGQKRIVEASTMTPEAYYDFLNELYRNHDEYKKAKGKEGTDTHALIEKYIKKCLENRGIVLSTDAYTDFKEIKSFVEWANEDVQRFLWSEAHCYSEKLWLGGITDFGFIHKNGKIIIGDNKPSIYPKHFIQTALYGIQIKENGLFSKDGMRQIEPISTLMGRIDGYCIFDYNKGEVRYRTDVERLESYGKLVVDYYDHKDIIGLPTLE